MSDLLINELEKAREDRKAVQSLKLLNDCRQLMSSRLNQSFSGMLDKLGDQLFALAEKAGDHETQNLYVDAKVIVEKNREALSKALLDHFLNDFSSQTHVQIPTREPAAFDFDIELSLVQDDVLEEDLAISAASERIKYSCSQELPALDQRIQLLLTNLKLTEAPNPFAPLYICKAFNKACGILDVTLKTRLILFKLFEEYMGAQLLNSYRDLNQFLIENEVLPRIRATVKKTSSPESRLSPVGVPTDAPHDEQDLFATLHRLMAYVANTGAPSGSVTGLTGTAIAANNPSASLRSMMPKLPPLNTSVFNALTQLQRGDADFLVSEGEVFDPSLIVSGTANILRSIKASNVGHGMDQVESITIDIVAMLFDYIFEDKNIPDAMKALIGRLQIPILKVAIIDRKFFSSQGHPTRKLLDTLAEAAVGWDEHEGTDGLYQKITDIVQRILREFEDNVNVFADVLRELEDFLSAEEEQAKLRVEFSTLAIQETERLEMAKLAAGDEIRRRLKQADIPELITRFLAIHWENVLFLKYNKGGTDGDAWNAAIKTVDDLIWSVLPKNTSEERDRLVAILPSLLKRLREGMDMCAMPVPERDRFFSGLVRCHAVAVNPASSLPSQESSDSTASADSVIEQASLAHPATDRDAAAATEINTATQGSLGDEGFTETLREFGDFPDVEEITIEDLAGPIELPECGDQYSEMAIQLKTGDWVEFAKDNGMMLRARLAAISQLKGVYLFTNRHGMEAARMPLSELASRFREGTAEILENVPLFDRAVGNVIGILRNATAKP